jgi:hypothetical protein
MAEVQEEETSVRFPPVRLREDQLHALHVMSALELGTEAKERVAPTRNYREVAESTPTRCASHPLRSDVRATPVQSWYQRHSASSAPLHSAP